MYPAVLSLHNVIRWIALVFGILAAVRAFLGWLGGREWTSNVRRTGSIFTIAMDIQLLLGLILFLFLSPITSQAFQDIGTAMGVADLRFFILEHPMYMVLAVLCAHVGNVMLKKAEHEKNKYRPAAIWLTLSVLALILGMPWMSRLFPGL